MPKKKERTYTVVAVCCCGCDNNEIHWVDAVTPEEAAESIQKDLKQPKRIVAVLKGAHREERKG